MPFNTAEAIQLVRDIASNEQVRVSVSGSVKGGLAVGCAAAAGALVFGPVGLAVGGALGGVGAAVAMRDQFVSLPEAIANMSADQKAALASKVENIAADLNITDVAALGLMLAGNNDLRSRVVQELICFVGSELQVAIA